MVYFLIMEYQIILTTLIAFVAVMTGLGFIFNLLLKPVKDNQARMEKELTVVKNDINSLKEDVSTIKQAVLKNTA